MGEGHGKSSYTPAVCFKHSPGAVLDTKRKHRENQFPAATPDECSVLADHEARIKITAKRDNG
jgi:hypothetical protein